MVWLPSTSLTSLLMSDRNPGNNEMNYVQALAAAVQQNGMASPHFIVDSGTTLLSPKMLNKVL